MAPSYFTVADDYVYQAGHESLAVWKLGEVPYPENNKPNAERIALGKMLFFDPRLSRDGNMSCATCHSPLFGWSDGLPTAKGFQSKVLGRASPTVVNTAYNTIQMWDGRKKSLEDQAMGPMRSNAEMNMDIPTLMNWLNENKTYKAAFNQAYPGEAIGEITVSKAIASFERTVISNNSPFDAWLNGDKKAMTAAQVRGFEIFVNPNKGNCEVCHSGANFTDNGFHNIGLQSFGDKNPDLGRYAQKPIRLMKGAFKTPTLRDITYTAPYFHDGSAETLEEVIDHYVKGGVVKDNLSPNIKALTLSAQEKADLVDFLEALSSPKKPFTLPVLP
ncbi:MAG: hypothetical protein KTR20_14790 [Cellvibrionaceae bacterium]|nr:hypothetical protein [Cellvibrionaceae bacterium]